MCHRICFFQRGFQAAGGSATDADAEYVAEYAQHAKHAQHAERLALILISRDGSTLPTCESITDKGPDGRYATPLDATRVPAFRMTKTWELMVLVMYDLGISSLEVPASALGSTTGYDGRALNQKKHGMFGE